MNTRTFFPSTSVRCDLASILTLMDKLAGAVERITFYNPENGYSVLRLRPEVRGRQRLPGLSRDGLITVVGNLPEVSPGEHLKLEGIWDTHPKHGKQFKAEICEQALPSTIAGMASYLHGWDKNQYTFPSIDNRRGYCTWYLHTLDNNLEFLFPSLGVTINRHHSNENKYLMRARLIPPVFGA